MGTERSSSLALDPRYATTLANLAAALVQQGRADQALALSRQALWIDPQHTFARQIADPHGIGAGRNGSRRAGRHFFPGG